MSNINRKANAFITKRGKIHAIPASDVEQFAAEILSFGVEAALPQNLPDRWLKRIGRDVAESLKANYEGRDDPKISLATPLLAVTALLSERVAFSGAVPSLYEEELLHGLERYGDAITEEIIGRATGVFIRNYTVDSVV